MQLYDALCVIFGMTEYSPRISRAYTPRYAEMDDDGVVTPVAMMGLFEETAVAHCDEAGWDVYRLRREGYGWMMLEGGHSPVSRRATGL